VIGLRFSEARPGRVLVVRLEQGEDVRSSLETLAQQQGVRAASVILLGAVDEGSRLVVGPEDGHAERIVPMRHVLEAPHEVAGVGTIFPDESGRPVLHMHAAAGRGGGASAGCLREGVKVWLVAEAIVTELLDCTARRAMEPSGLQLMQP